jgi:hypothetical protein
MKEKKEKNPKESRSRKTSEDDKDGELKPSRKLLSFTRTKKPSKKIQEAESLKIPDFDEYRDLIEDSDDVVQGEGRYHLPCTFRSYAAPLSNGKFKKETATPFGSNIPNLPRVDTLRCR